MRLTDDMQPGKPTRRIRSLLLAGLISISGSAALAQPSSISLNTEQRPGLIRVLSLSDRDLYLRAYQASEHGDWVAARALAAQGHDAMAQRIIEWRYLLDKNSGASFAEISAFLRANPEWPARDDLFARAETTMDPNMQPAAVLSFFFGRDPLSDVGKLRLGEAYLATGDVTKGRPLIRDAWIHGDFDLSQEFSIIQRHGDLLSPDVDRARLNRLLFENQLTAARREMARVPSDAQEVAQARLTLHSNAIQGMRLVTTLPPSLQNDPGLLFDRARMLRQQNSVESIPPLMSRTPTRDMAQINPGKWWNEINLAARQALKDHSYRTAHALVDNNGLQPGADYADAEFMAGWLDLRFLHNAREAHTHFANIAKSVTRPISKSRGLYWAGRASEAAGDYAQARIDYQAAGQIAESFYGQLALAKLNTPTLHVRNDALETTAAERAAYESHDLTRAMRVLGDLGLVQLLRTFATYDAETHPEPKHLNLLVADLVRMGFKDVAIRAAKTASYSGVRLLAYSHPVISLPGYVGPGYAPEPAFVHGIIRQETEFDTAAVSGSGARGLMQLMPASAKHDAGLAGFSYRLDDLTQDPVYNARLGMVELADDLATYGGSYVLTAAAYNAGKTNVNRWIATFGDPRTPSVDPVDWIEEIPFTETRNYVQRVLENTEVYRNRLSGRDEPLRILTDLYRPRAPQVRSLPQLRSDGGSSRSVADK
jgi:soluble lytic murein transglycosylase